MNVDEEKKLREFSSYLLIEYGFDFRPLDPVLPALYTFHKETLRVKATNERLEKEVKTGNKELRDEVKSIVSSLQPITYNFNAPGEALKFKYGQAGIFGIVCFTFLIALWSILHYVQIFREEKTKVSIVSKLDAIEQTILPALKIDDAGNLYLESSKMSKDTLMVNEFIQIENGKVRVYLGAIKKK